jgi:hypothetical protein
MILVAPVLIALCTPAEAALDVDSQSAAQAVVVQNSDVTYKTKPVLPQGMPVYPNLLQQIPGQMGDVTSEVPIIEGMFPFKGEVIVRGPDAVQVQYGWFGDRVRLEDIERDLIKFWEEVKEKKGWKDDEMRYRVQFKANFRSVGTGGGVVATGSTASSGGLSGGAGTLGILPGFSSTLTDHHFIIKIYHIKLAEKEKVSRWLYDTTTNKWTKQVTDKEVLK